MPLFEKIYLLGTGLIGGSLALDLKDRGLVGRIIGSDSDPESAEAAVGLEILDEILPMDSDVLKECDLVVLTVPMMSLNSLLSKGFEKETLVTDAGSVKGSCIKSYREAVEKGRGYRYVPGHPIAGDEKSGPAAARKGLFDGARVILTPVDADKEDVLAISGLWEGVGAEVKLMSAEEHDETFAWVSHMPHMGAYAMIDSIMARDPGLIGLSGGGLRDYTRIAASSPRMWADIAMANREELLKATRGLEESIENLIQALEEGDRDKLEEIFSRIAQAGRSIG